MPDLLNSADDVLNSSNSASQMWLHAASLVYRAAVEAMLEELWAMNAPRMREVPRATQLLCLGSWIEPEVAREVGLLWNELSDMAHHRLDGGPDPARVRRAGEGVRRVAEVLGHVEPPPLSAPFAHP